MRRATKGMLVLCVVVLRLVYRCVAPCLSLVRKLGVETSLSAVRFVVTVSGPLDSALVRQIGLVGVTSLTMLWWLLQVLIGRLLLTIPLKADRLGCMLHSRRVLLGVIWKLATILLKTSSVLRCA